MVKTKGVSGSFNNIAQYAVDEDNERIADQIKSAYFKQDKSYPQEPLQQADETFDFSTVAFSSDVDKLASGIMAMQGRQSLDNSAGVKRISGEKAENLIPLYNNAVRQINLRGNTNSVKNYMYKCRF